MLTDLVYWGVIFPFLTLEEYKLNLVSSEEFKYQLFVAFSCVSKFSHSCYRTNTRHNCGISSVKNIAFEVEILEYELKEAFLH